MVSPARPRGSRGFAFSGRTAVDIDYVNVVNQLDTSFTYALDNPDRPGV